MQRFLPTTFAAIACAVLAACSTPGGPVPVQTSTVVAPKHLYVLATGDLKVFTLPLTAASTPSITALNAGNGGMSVSSTQLAVGNGSTTNVYALPITSSSAPAFSIPAGAQVNDAKFDASGNLWVAAPRSFSCCIYEYTTPLSASSTPALTLNEPSSGGGQLAQGLAFDSGGNLYASGYMANDMFTPPFSSSSTATTFGSSYDVDGIAAAGGRVYVPNGTADGALDVYNTPITSGSTKAFTLTPSTNQIGYPSFDASGNMYVPVYNDNKIYVYTAPIAASSTPAFSVAITNPYTTAVGP